MSSEATGGNARVLALLERLARAGAVPPSLLFAGPSGVGKLRAALTLAQALNCKNAAERGTACGVCPSCLRIERGEHADVRIVRPEGAGRQIKIEAVRSIVGEMPFRPFEGSHRVAILVDADRLNDNAANTLLKTLEEPPAWAVLVLITSNESNLLPTLLSRCQVLRFAPLALEDVMNVLVDKHGIDEERARLLASLASGSVTKALELEEEPLGDLRDMAFRLASVVTRGGSEQELVSLSDALSKDARLLLLLLLTLGVMRDVATAAGGGDVVHLDRVTELQSLGGKASLATWLAAYALVETAYEDLRDRYLNKRIVAGKLLVDLKGLQAGA